MPVGPSAGLSAGFPPSPDRSGLPAPSIIAQALSQSGIVAGKAHDGEGEARMRAIREASPDERPRPEREDGRSPEWEGGVLPRLRRAVRGVFGGHWGMWGAWPDGRAGRTCFRRLLLGHGRLPARGRFAVVACLPAAGALRCIRWWALWRPSWRLRVPSAASWGRCRGLPRRFQTGRMARRGSLSAWAAFLWRWFGLPPMRRFLSWRLSGKAPFRFFGEWRWRPLGSGRLRDFPWRCAVVVLLALSAGFGGVRPAGFRRRAGAGRQEGACREGMRQPRGRGWPKSARLPAWHACVRPRRMCVRRLRRPPRLPGSRGGRAADAGLEPLGKRHRLVALLRPSWAALCGLAVCAFLLGLLWAQEAPTHVSGSSSIWGNVGFVGPLIVAGGMACAARRLQGYAEAKRLLLGGHARGSGAFRDHAAVRRHRFCRVERAGGELAKRRLGGAHRVHVVASAGICARFRASHGPWRLADASPSWRACRLWASPFTMQWARRRTWWQSSCSSRICAPRWCSWQWTGRKSRWRASRKEASLRRTLRRAARRLRKPTPSRRAKAEMLTLLSRGHSYGFIAESAYISEATVRTHARNIYRKIGVSSQGRPPELHRLPVVRRAAGAWRAAGGAPRMQCATRRGWCGGRHGRCVRCGWCGGWRARRADGRHGRCVRCGWSAVPHARGGSRVTGGPRAFSFLPSRLMRRHFPLSLPSRALLSSP